MLPLKIHIYNISRQVKQIVSGITLFKPKVNKKIITKVRKKKVQNKMRGLSYIEKPNLSIIVQSFNHVNNIEHIITSLRKTKAEEIIVSEDGSIDGSHETWMKYLDHPNDFLIHSNDLHEIRASDRAISFARGEIICLVQDDDELPETGDWVEHSLSLFDTHPKLAILGGFQGLMWNQLDGSDNEVRQKASIFGKNSKKIPYTDPSVGIPFMFIEEVNIGPYFIRKRVFEKIQGWDFNYSNVGEPGIGFDHDLCLRCWNAGYQVGLIEIIKRKYEELTGGTFLWGLDVRKKNRISNLSKRIAFYRAHSVSIRKAVNEANEQLKKS